jgi:flavin-dependent dehydrogenase
MAVLVAEVHRQPEKKVEAGWPGVPNIFRKNSPYVRWVTLVEGARVHLPGREIGFEDEYHDAQDDDGLD